MMAESAASRGIGLLRKLSGGPCLCSAATAINDEVAGETLCGVCGVVLHEREARMVWDGMGGWHDVRRATGRSGRSITEFVTTQRMVSGATDVRRDALMRTIIPMLEHVSASAVIKNEAESLVRRMTSDGFAKGRHRLTLCAGTVLAACRVHGRMIRREDLAMLTGTSFKGVSRISRGIMERYGLKPLSIEDRTRRVLSRMCIDVGAPGLLRPALDTYDAMLLAGHASGKSPYVVAAYVLRLHTRRIMSEEKFAERVGVPHQSMQRYVGGLMPNAC